MNRFKVLFASRAYESPNTEGGFVHLKDIAARTAADDAFEAIFLSCAGERVENGIAMAGGFSGTGWGKRASWQFVRALRDRRSMVDLVHTAHVPTRLNSRILLALRNAASEQGARYVQTVTAVPDARYLRKSLFWGDAITCLNTTATTVVSRYHENVRTIAPVPAPTRLKGRTVMPGAIAERLADNLVVCFPVQLARIESPAFLMDLSCALLQRVDTLQVVFACRFGDDRRLQRLIDAVPSQYRARISVVGPVEWILDLFRASRVVAYPADRIEKKFNPPMVLLEAACLGASVVTSPGIDAAESFGKCPVRRVAAGGVERWVEAILEALDDPPLADVSQEHFERSYRMYRELYLELLERR